MLNIQGKNVCFLAKTPLVCNFVFVEKKPMVEKSIEKFLLRRDKKKGRFCLQMNDLYSVFAKNIADLRAERKMTQAQLAAELNYSDKAISKWERGEALPDVTVVKQIADTFGVSVDYLLQSEHKPLDRRPDAAHRQIRLNRLLISAIATTLLWLIATFLFLVFNALPQVLLPFPTWLFFVYSAVPSLIVILVFNSIWGRRRLNFAIISALVWSLLATVFLSILVMAKINLWQIFLFGIPSQCIVMLWSGLKNPQKGKEIGNASYNAPAPSDVE